MQNIQSLITDTIHSLYGVDFSPEITVAPKPELGEYCINVFPLAKTAGKAPNILSEEIATALAKHTDIFVSTNATGGYVNFFLTDKVWIDLLQSNVIASGTGGSAAIQVSGKQGTGLLRTSQGQKTIIVDYIGANAGKPLHIGHICTPSIGQVICNVYHHLGYRVIGDSHFGDWGGIFGKLICINKIGLLIKGLLPENERERYIFLLNIISKFNFPDEDSKITWAVKLVNEGTSHIGSNDYSLYTEYMRAFYMVATYIGDREEEFDRQFREEFFRLSNGDLDSIETWKKITHYSINASQKQLELLNVHATYNIGESFYEGLGLPRPNGEDYPDLTYTMKDIVQELLKKGIATQNEDGSVGVVFPDEVKMPSCVLQKKDGTGLYLTSDLAAIKYRLTNGWNPSKIIYSVDVRQQLHLKQAFWIAQKAWGEELGAKDIEFFHAFNGFIKLKEGAMSTRHGTVIFLEKLIEEGNERTEKILAEKGRIGDKALSPEDIQAITVGAIKYSYLAQDREKDVTFDWDKALNFEGNSGPYIQYAFVRASKITREAGVSGGGKEQDFSTSAIASARNDKNLELGTWNFELSSHDKSLIQSLARMQSIIEETASKYKPHILALYCYDLAVAFNSFYVHTPKILEESDIGLKNLRLSLISQFVKQIELGFDLLGMKMPSEM